jgi:hypothetical protein
MAYTESQPKELGTVSLNVSNASRFNYCNKSCSAAAKSIRQFLGLFSSQNYIPREYTRWRKGHWAVCTEHLSLESSVVCVIPYFPLTIPLIQFLC